jgi:hypothetical protein
MDPGDKHRDDNRRQLVSVPGDDPFSLFRLLLCRFGDERIEIEGAGGTALLSFDKRRTQRLDPRFGHGCILPLLNEYQIWYIRPMRLGFRACVILRTA